MLSRQLTQVLDVISLHYQADLYAAVRTYSLCGVLLKKRWMSRHLSILAVIRLLLDTALPLSIRGWHSMLEQSLA